MRKGKRLISAWLAGCMFLLLLFGNGSVVSAAEADVPKGTESRTAAGKAAEEDVTIDSLDVEYETVNWTGSSAEGNVVMKQARNNEIVLLLDVSGSMGGTPMDQLKKACYNFIDDILAEDPDVGIGIVTFESSVRTYTFDGEYFTNDRNDLRSVVRSLSALGNTAMNAGMLEADRVLQTYGEAMQQYLIVMADGMPNGGEAYYGEDARYKESAYCSAVYNTFLGIESEYIIYSLGYFHSLSGSEKELAVRFMKDIQNNGYIEVNDADQIAFSFEGLADNINTDMVSLSVSSLAMKKNKTEQLSVVYSDAYTSKDREVEWTSRDPSVASVDAEGKVTAWKEGDTVIMASVGGYTATCRVTVTKEKPVGTLKLNILQNENDQSQDRDHYIKAADAIVTYDNTDYKANSNGQVLIPKYETGEIQVSKAGFRTRSIAFANLTDNQKIYLQKESDNPTINAVWAESVNVLSEEYPVDLTKSGTITLSVDLDWGNADSGTLQLGQEAVFVDFPAGKTTLALNLSEKFDVSKDIYLIAKNAKGNTVKRQLAFTVDSAAAGLDGFKVSFGKDIKFTIPKEVPFLGGGELSLDVLKNEVLPVTVSVEDGKVKAALGIDLDKTSYSSTTDRDGEKSGEWESTNALEQAKNVKSNVSDFIKSVKNLKGSKSKSASDVWKSIKKKYGDDIVKKKGSFGVKSDIQVMGYAEGYLDAENKIQLTEAGLYVVLSAKASWSGNLTVQVVVVPVPVYWEASVGGEAKAGFNMSYDAGTDKYVPNGELSAKLEGSVGGGLGNTNIATIGGGGKASISPQMKFYSTRENYYAIKLAINAYFKLTAFKIYEKTWEPESLKKEWTFDNGVKSISLAGKEIAAAENLYRAEDYVLADLSYLSSGGASMTEISEPDAGGGYAQDILMVQENALSETSPQIREFGDGKKIAIWFQASEADVNTVALYYSYFDGKNWSDPAAVEKDGTPDLDAQLYVSDSDTCMVVWEDTKQPLSEKVDTLDKLKQVEVEIQAASFDFSKACFSQAVPLNESTKGLPVMPVISGAGNTIHVSWIENSENDWFGTKGSNSVLTCTCTDGQWGKPEVSYDNIKETILGLASDTKGSDLTLAYAADADRDYNTTSDQEIYVNGKQITDNEVSDKNLKFEDHILYWDQEGGIVYRKDAAASPTETLLESGSLLYNDYRIVSDGGIRTALLLVPDGMKNSIMGATETEKGWSEPIQISDPADSTEITDFSACWSDGALQMLCNRVHITGEMEYGQSAAENYGQTDLVLMEYRPQQAVSIADAVYDIAEITEGLMETSLSVKNCSVEKIAGVHIAVTDADGQVIQESDIQKTLQAGETVEIPFSLIVPEGQLGKTVTISVTPKDRDTVAAAGSVEIALSYEDIAVDDAGWAFDGDNTVMIFANVINNGLHDVESVKLNLCKDSPEGDILQSAVVTNLTAQNRAGISFDGVSFESDAMYYVTAEVPDVDENAGNNSDFVVTTADKAVSGRTLSGITAELKKTNYTVGETLDLGGLSVTAAYSDGSRSAVTADADIDLSGVKMTAAGTYQIRISYEGKTAAVSVVVVQKQAAQNPPAAAPAQTVKMPAKGTVIKSGKMQYKVSSSPGKTATVTVSGCSGKKTVTSVSIPQTVTYKGIKYKVTAISANAFKNAKKLKKVVIGKNVTQIGSKAFYGCKKLTGVTIKTRSLKKVGSRAFGKIGAKAKYTVPKAKYKAYKKMLSAKKTGYVKTQKIKKGK